MAKELKAVPFGSSRYQGAELDIYDPTLERRSFHQVRIPLWLLPRMEITGGKTEVIFARQNGEKAKSNYK